MEFTKYDERGAYHHDWYGKDEAYTDCVDAIVKRVSGDVLDLGCGDGLVCKLLADNGCSVRGIDDSDIGLELARKAVPNADFELANIDILNPSIFDGYDWVVCLNTIEHLENPERLATFPIKRGIIITDYPGETVGKHHKREFTPQELKDLFSKNFKVKRLRLKNKDYHGIEITAE